MKLKVNHLTLKKMNELFNLHQRFSRYCSIELGDTKSTVHSRSSSFKTFLKRTGITAPSELTEDKCRTFFYDGAEIHHWSDYHYINNLKYLNKFFNWCVQQKYLKKNPLAGMPRPKMPKALPRRLSEEDGRKVLNASYGYNWRYDFEQTRNHAMISTLLFSGLRLSELLNLQMTDVDLVEKTILVRHGKGDKDRQVPIHYQLHRTLVRYERERKTMGKKSEWFFTGVHSDKKLTPKDLSKICRKIGAYAGVRFTPHQLRHTFASRCIDEGFNVVQLKEVLGHSSLSSTMIYLKVAPKSLRESINRLELF